MSNNLEANSLIGLKISDAILFVHSGAIIFSKDDQKPIKSILVREPDVVYRDLYVNGRLNVKTQDGGNY
jgi:hypothetical protein